MLFEIYWGLSLLILFVAIFVVAKITHQILTPYNADEQLTQKDNFAVSISLSGYLFAVVLIFAGTVFGPSQGWVEDLLGIGGYSLLGIVLLNISRIFNDKLILQKFSNVKEIIEDQNAGVATVQMGSYIASGLVIAGTLIGEGGGLLQVLVFFVLGQLSLLLMAKIYNFITPYDLHHELEKDNVSAGIGFAGTLIAIGIILLSSLSGDFTGWGVSLKSFAIDAAIAFATLPLFRIFFDKVILKGADLNYEIKNNQNKGAALLEMTLTISVCIVLFLLLRG